MRGIVPLPEHCERLQGLKPVAIRDVTADPKVRPLRTMLGSELPGEEEMAQPPEF